MADDELLPYESQRPNAYEWTVAAYMALGVTLQADVTAEGGVWAARIDGQCPRCHHHIHDRQQLEAVTSETTKFLGRDLQADGAWDDYIPLTGSCTCAEGHPGRPENVKQGCGINFDIQVLPDGAGT